MKIFWSFLGTAFASSVENRSRLVVSGPATYCRLRFSNRYISGAVVVQSPPHLVFCFEASSTAS